MNILMYIYLFLAKTSFEVVINFLSYLEGHFLQSYQLFYSCSAQSSTGLPFYILIISTIFKKKILRIVLFHVITVFRDFTNNKKSDIIGNKLYKKKKKNDSE